MIVVENGGHVVCEIVFYEDRNGKSDVEQFIDDLVLRGPPRSKDARIQLDQIETALNRLEKLVRHQFLMCGQRRFIR